MCGRLVGRVFNGYSGTKVAGSILQCFSRESAAPGPALGLGTPSSLYAGATGSTPDLWHLACFSL